MTHARRALLSVTNKRELAPFARGLAAAGFELVSTGGTATLLEREGIAVTRVSDVTGVAEMMDGRVKTLHPAVFGGILARRHLPADQRDLEANGIRPIDVVVVNLYAFEAAAADSSLSDADVIEQIDIGGPSLIRAAAKNHTDVFVVVDPDDYGRVLEALTPGDGAANVSSIRRSLARKAFEHTARYDAAIANWFTGEEALPQNLIVHGRVAGDLRYGENPHQSAGLYRTGPGYADARIHQGKGLSYNNWLDLAAAYDLCRDLTGGPAAVIVKHTNPCGAAVDAGGLLAAYERALASDPTSAFGGIVALNGRVEADLAEALTQLFLEVVIAPDFSEAALGIFATKKNLRVLSHPARRASSGRHVRSIEGALLVQEADLATLDVRECRVATKRTPTAAEYDALQFAWETVKHVKSNAIVFAEGRATAAVGAGQMSRIDSVLLCRHKARRPLAGSVAASDAFFPFRDGVDVLREAGATAIVQPGGSVRDPEVIAAADEHGLAMIFTGRRHFRH